MVKLQIYGKERRIVNFEKKTDGENWRFTYKGFYTEITREDDGKLYINSQNPEISFGTIYDGYADFEKMEEAAKDVLENIYEAINQK